MSYEYTDNDSSTMAFKMPDEVSFIIGIHHKRSDTYANIGIMNEDAPRVALEILKAAGFDSGTESTGLAMAFTYLNDAVGLMDIYKKADALNNRRDELAQELAEDGAYAYRFANPSMKRAIDRIIELESKP